MLGIIDASIDGRLADIHISWKKLSACNLVLASGGYPGEYEEGKSDFRYSRRRELSQRGSFYAGTIKKDGTFFTNGGRILGVSAVGGNLKEALSTAYKAVSKISFEGMQYRKDIGKSALER